MLKPIQLEIAITATIIPIKIFLPLEREILFQAFLMIYIFDIPSFDCNNLLPLMSDLPMQSSIILLRLFHGCAFSSLWPFLSELLSGFIVFYNSLDCKRLSPLVRAIQDWRAAEFIQQSLRGAKRSNEMQIEISASYLPQRHKSGVWKECGAFLSYFTSHQMKCRPFGVRLNFLFKNSLRITNSNPISPPEMIMPNANRNTEE